MTKIIQKSGCRCYMHYLKRLLLLNQIIDTAPDVVRFSLIQSSGRLFSLCLPGCTLLIPKYLKAYREMVFKFDKATRTDVPNEVVTAIIHSLGALVALEKRYEDRIEELETFDYVKTNRVAIKVILQNLLQTHSALKNYDHCESILWLFGLYVVEDKLSQLAPISDPIIILLDHIAFRDIRVTSAATDSLSVIAANSKRLGLAQEDMVIIMDRILFAIPDHLSHGKTKKELALTCNIILISNHFNQDL